jgi:hypothetical protein
MSSCKVCGSQAINPGKHGRDLTSNIDLCDVCFWRKRAEDYAAQNFKLIKVVEGYSKLSKLVEEATEKIKGLAK